LGIWSLDGGLTAANVQATIDFLTKLDALPAGLSAERVADLSYLAAVVDRLDRDENRAP
jgi:hypothetical protein